MGDRSGVRVAMAVLAALALAAGCGDGADRSEATAAPEQVSSTTTPPLDPTTIEVGGELIVGLAAETATFLPSAGSFSEAGIQIAYAVFDPIASRGEDGQVHPFAAESIDANADATEWTVRLRDGLEFHDGTQLTAEVMRAIFDEYLTAEASVVAGDLAQVVELRVDDDLTVTYVLERSNAAFADLLTGPVGWPFSVEACRAAGEACGERPVGTGPFRFVSWNRDDRLVVDRNPAYWRSDAAGNPLPYLDRITFVPLPDQATRLLSVRSGTTHAGGTFLADVIREVRATDGVESFEWIGSSGSVTLFNTLRPPLDDQRVRRALGMAIDQEEAIAVSGGTGIVEPKTQLHPTGSWWYSDAVAGAWDPYDPSAARALLDDYLEDPDRSDGRRPGEPIALAYQAGPDPAIQQVAQYYQAEWTALGVEVEIVSVDQPVLIANVVGGADDSPPFSGDYQVSIFRAGGESDPYTTLSRMVGDPSTQPGNFTNYWSPAIDEALEALRASTDPEVRHAANEAIMRELAEQVPMLWQGAIAASVYVAPEVRNLTGWTIPGPAGSDPIPGAGVANGQPHWSHVWLATD